MKTKTITSFAFEVKGQLPQILQSVVNHSASPAEADIMLMGAITTLSATLPNSMASMTKTLFFLISTFSLMLRLRQVRVD